MCLTTTVKCGKTGYGLSAGTIKRCSEILEREIALFADVQAGPSSSIEKSKRRMGRALNLWVEARKDLPVDGTMCQTKTRLGGQSEQGSNSRAV